MSGQNKTQRTPTPQLDYKKIFDLMPDPYWVISANPPVFTVLEVNDAHNQVSKLKRKDIIGKPLFEVYPDKSKKFLTTGINDVELSLLRVIETRKSDVMDTIQYSLKQPDGPQGLHYWQPVNVPILDEKGDVEFIVQSSRNVTSQVITERDLKEAKDQLDDALSAGLIGTWAVDVAKEVVIADKNLSVMFGVDPDKAAKGLPLSVFIDSIHPEDRDRVVAAIQHAMSTGEEYDIEYRTLGLNEDIRWVITRGDMSYDDAGNPVKFSGVIIDITERKQIEEAVKDSQAQLKFMAESMPQKIFTTTPAGVVDYYNPQWLEFTGLKEGQLTENGWTDIIHPDDIEETRKAWKHSLDTGEPYENECRFRRADGEYRWHLTRMNPMRNSKGKIIKWVGSNTDISDRKQQELNLNFLSHASKVLSSSLDYDQTLKQMAQLAVPDVADWCAIDIYDEQSATVTQMAVVHKDPEKISKAIEYRKMTPPDLTDDKGLAGVLRTGESQLVPVIEDSLLVMMVKDKKALKLIRSLGLYSYMIVPLKVAGRVAGAITFVSSEHKRSFAKSDLEFAEELAYRASMAIYNSSLYKSAQREIEYRERLEEELRLANEQLESRVKVRTELLEVANLNLERSNQELQDFAYVASHDLQEPLRKIQAFGNLLQEEYTEKLGDGKDYLDRMRSAAARMSVLIEDLLAFSRVTTHAKPVAKIKLNKIVNEVIEDLEIRINETKGQVLVKDLPVFVADPLQMRQLFQNLIGNALKFHDKNRAPIVKVYSESHKGKSGKIEQYTIFVEDNGIGFDEKYLDRIFAVFQRLHIRDSYSGTGIGLAVCRKIVERHGGAITAQSKVGKGSKFIITLPISNKGDEDDS